MRDKIECQFCGNPYSSQGVSLHEIHCPSRPVESAITAVDTEPSVVVYQQNSSDTNNRKGSGFWSVVTWLVVILGVVWYMYDWYAHKNAVAPIVDENGRVIVPFH